MKKIEISIIIPVYNVEKYIEKCLKSILLQSFSNIEVIIINDGSSDNSEEIIEKIMKNDERVRYFKYRNEGVSIARNTGLSFAQGDYVIFIDPDDYLEVDFLENLYNAIILNNADISLCGYKITYSEDVPGLNKDVIYPFKDDIISGKTAAEKLLEFKLDGYVWNKLIRKELMIKNNILFEKNRYVQDYFPIFKCFCNSKKVAIVNKPLYYYVQRKTSTINSKSEKVFYDHIYATNKIMELATTCYCNEDYINYFKIINYINYFKKYTSLNYEKKGDIYIKFKEDIVDSYTVLYNEVLFNNILTIKEKSKFLAYLFIWNLKILHIFVYFKKFIEEYF
ncbi:glycosyltransferase family 2 protein [Turicibacter sanguinis]|uniref:glycosyltransferase family 2 protein n=1 Tax=Turicibacter sanguinis TaxID=154288 RepID=UPI00232BAB1A|nr:glycosyltransferase family 2 protein [Turicibacter sanguinis]MDB8460403.1 glycosyltransferase [Turicibacter sanguinis]